jgi:hypothetical protein
VSETMKHFRRNGPNISVARNGGVMWFSECDGCGDHKPCASWEFDNECGTEFIDLCPDCLRALASEVEKWHAEQERDNDD